MAGKRGSRKMARALAAVAESTLPGMVPCASENGAAGLDTKRRGGTVMDSLSFLKAARGRRRTSILAAALAVFIVVWAAAGLLTGGGFAISSTGALQGAEVVASALSQLFAALVLGLFLARESGWRMHWVAAGLVALGLAHMIFGYVEPLIQGAAPGLNESLYEGLISQVLACALFAVGMYPGTPHRYLARAALIVPLALIAGYIFIFEVLDNEALMPALAGVEKPEQALALGSSLLWLTPWHWLLSAFPLALAAVAVAGAFRETRRGLLPGWLLFTVVLLAGSILHEYVWPSTFAGKVVTTADALHLTLAVVAAVGGILELKRASDERESLLLDERERTRRLSELAALRADFSAMVAHELGSPTAAIRNLSAMLGVDGLNEEAKTYALGAIRRETDALEALVSDVRAAATVERDDFRVSERHVMLGELLSEAGAFARALPGGHSVRVVSGMDREVVADPERIGQVLRNLLSNAAKYSPEGTVIELRAKPLEDSVRVEVADHGSGIHPDDLRRVFEKFGRGRDGDGKKVAGVGLGLYLSRRIVQAHGSELDVSSALGEGSVFGFDLEVRPSAKELPKRSG